MIFFIINMQKMIDFTFNRCKYVIIMQDFKRVFQKLQNYSEKVILLHLNVTKNVFYDKNCIFSEEPTLHRCVGSVGNCGKWVKNEKICLL
jgi:hypothetical protein